MDLTTPVASVNRSYKIYSKRLEKLGIVTLGDFLLHLPFRYVDYSLISSIDHVQAGETITVQGKVTEIKNQYLKSRKTLQKATVKDETGEITVVWFNQPFLTKSIQPQDSISLSGTVHKFGTGISLQNPEHELLSGNSTLHTGRLIPVYHETAGISSKWLRRQIDTILKTITEHFYEYMPSSILEKYGFMDYVTALKKIHFPENLEEAENARRRLAFDELFLLQLSALSRKHEWQQHINGHPFFIDQHKKKLEELFEKLPFELTNAQRRTVNEIFVDLATPQPMNRLLEGDVGSGKTVVAGITMYLAFLNGFQSVLMAPTEILAQQQYQTLFSLLFPLGVKVSIATGVKKENLTNFDILVGTHAVLNNNIDYEKVGLIIIDEQQRFGVEQRAMLRKKGSSPHVLTMTATPIPRTVALTVYGDLDVSYLDEMPKGRQTVKTWLVPLGKREGAYAWIAEQIKTTDSQAFIICPFIEESESMQTVKAAKVEFERLRKNVFSDLKLGLLHGRLGREKDTILKQFKNRAFDILVATPVVEVGIDVQNATIMMIEAADRFGLSQLHQLRGRVGRGEKQSYCLLFTESESETTYNRLKSLEKIHFGPELAELDLKLRGAGDIYGTRQHGFKPLKVASFSDSELIHIARKEAQHIFLHIDNYPKLSEKLQSFSTQEVAPD